MKKILMLITAVLVFSSCKNNNYLNRNFNVIVESPVINEVTYEISEKLIGKYVDEDDPNAFFEIKSDGGLSISLHTFSGYALYNENLQLAMFYQNDENVILSFQLIGGEYTFPEVIFLLIFSVIQTVIILY